MSSRVHDGQGAPIYQVKAPHRATISARRKFFDLTSDFAARMVFSSDLVRAESQVAPQAIVAVVELNSGLIMVSPSVPSLHDRLVSPPWLSGWHINLLSLCCSRRLSRVLLFLPSWWWLLPMWKSPSGRSFRSALLAGQHVGSTSSREVDACCCLSPIRNSSFTRMSAGRQSVSSQTCISICRSGGGPVGLPRGSFAGTSEKCC